MSGVLQFLMKISQTIGKLQVIFTVYGQKFSQIGKFVYWISVNLRIFGQKFGKFANFLWKFWLIYKF